MPGAARTLLLLRHGETDWNARRVCQGQLDEARLTELGARHAAQVGASLHGDIDAVITSDLTRASQTAALVADACGVEVAGCDGRLRERSFGELEGGPLEALVPALTGISGGVVVDEDARCPGGESLRELRDRVASWMVELALAAPARRLCVVTHGGTIRAMRAVSAGVPMGGLAWDAVGNCTVWEVALPPAR